MKYRGQKYLSGEKVTSFQLSVSTLFASSLCIDRPAPFARARARARYTDRYKLFNLRMNGEILPGTQTKEEEEEEKEAEKVEGKRRGEEVPLLFYLVKGSLPRVRRTNLSPVSPPPPPRDLSRRQKS